MFPLWGWVIVALVLFFVAWGVIFIADGPERRMRRYFREQTWTEDRL
jgi:hypothetical protein